MGVPGWVVVACVAGVVLGDTPGLDRPDITMLYKGNTQICVAGGNTKGYGLAFMSETLAANVYINQFQYRDGNGTVIDSSYACDFELRPGDTCWENWRKDLILGKSGPNPISPVTDERWNNFENYRTIGATVKQSTIPPTYDKTYNIAQENFFTGISVRSTRDAHIILCTGGKNPRNSECYWIIIDGFTNHDFTTIRKCIKGVPDKWATEDDCKIFRANITAREKLLDESKWTHFMLSRENGNRVRLWLWDLHTGARPLLDYMDDAPLSLSYMYVRSYNAVADWKVHEYQYANILSRRSLIKLGPALRFARSSSICISLYVTLCSKCKMDIRLEIDDGVVETQTSIEGNSNGLFMTWRNVRLQGGVSTSLNQLYQLYATSSTIDGSDENTFWAIDDIRKCSNNEYRVSATYSSYNLLCQSLNFPNWQFNPNNQVTENEPPICSDGRYIGKHCNISCYSVTPYDYGCNGQKICLSTQEGNNKGACICAAGYVWGTDDCTQTCIEGYYGYNCKNKCGRCKYPNVCYINTGECPQGCENKYLPPYCRNTYPYLVSPPVVDSVFYKKIIVKINDLNTNGEEDIAQSIQLECMKANSYDTWHNCGDSIDFNLGQEISITGLEKQTTYHIRAIVCTKTGDAYRYNDVPTVEATTTCKVDREILITESSEAATIHFETTSDDDCSVESYQIELRQNLYQIRSPQTASQNTVLSNLTPYTEYTVRVTSIIYPSYINNTKFQTKQDAPSVIKYVRILERTDTTVVLSWQEPEEKNGVIQKYTVTYDLINRINCDEKPIWQNETMSVSPSMISQVTISGLQPYSIYNITVAAETILPGTPFGIQGNTTIMDDISEEELPDTISASNLSARSVTIRWPMNCLKQRGPLYFQIVLMCVQDEWCDQIQDIVLNNISSLNGGGTTHDLTPFTHYSVELRAKRSQSGDLTTISRTLDIYSLAGNPPAVRNATDYSRDSISISFRWLDPYPPHGYLEKYAIEYCYRTTWGCRTTEITSEEVAPCDLWDEHFNCYKFTNLNSNLEYTITILAKNRDIKLWSRDTILKVNTTEDKSSAPLNLTREWEHNEIKLSWNHPNITNGRLKKFIITLIQIETELKNQDDKPFYSYEHIVSKDMKIYSYKINKTYQYSSSYKVTVCGVNSYYGENAILYIDTLPDTPELTGDVTMDNQLTSESSVTITIPGVVKKTSFLYVVVSKISSTKKTITYHGNDLELKILKYSNYEDAWIAEEITDLNGKDVKIFLGSGKTSNIYYLKKKIINRELEPSTDYEVTLVLIDTYKNERSIKVYHKNIRTASAFHSELYGLILLLLLPVAIYFLYRLMKIKRIESTYITPEIHARTSYLEVIPDEEINGTQNIDQAEEHLYEIPIDIQNQGKRVDNEPAEEHEYESVSNLPNPPTYSNLLMQEREYANL